MSLDSSETVYNQFGGQSYMDLKWKLFDFQPGKSQRFCETFGLFDNFTLYDNWWKGYSD